MCHYFKVDEEKTLYNNPEFGFDRNSYETPHALIEMILEKLDPTIHFLWEPFKGTGYSTDYMRKRGFQVTNGDHEDFFDHSSLPSEYNPEFFELVVVTNPPFNKKWEVLKKLQTLACSKVAYLLPIGCIYASKFPTYFPCPKLVFIVINGRIKFISPLDGQQLKKSASFDCSWILFNFEDIFNETQVNFRSFQEYKKIAQNK